MIGKAVSISASPAQETVPVAQRKRIRTAGSRFDELPEVRAPDVRSYRASQSLAIAVMKHEPVRIGQTRVISVGREHQRRAARPAANDFSGEPFAPLRGTIEAARRPVHEGPKSINILSKLAEH